MNVCLSTCLLSLLYIALVDRLSVVVVITYQYLIRTLTSSSIIPKVKVCLWNFLICSIRIHIWNITIVASCTCCPKIASINLVIYCRVNLFWLVLLLLLIRRFIYFMLLLSMWHIIRNNSSCDVIAIQLMLLR